MERKQKFIQERRNKIRAAIAAMAAGYTGTQFTNNTAYSWRRPFHCFPISRQRLRAPQGNTTWFVSGYQLQFFKRQHFIPQVILVRYWWPMNAAALKDQPSNN
jgi:hypothetical protein